MDSKEKLGISRENSWGDINLQTTHKPGLTDIRPTSKSSNVRHYHPPREPINLMLNSYSTEYFEPQSALPALKAKLAAAKQLVKGQRYSNKPAKQETPPEPYPYPTNTYKAHNNLFLSATSENYTKSRCLDLNRKSTSLNATNSQNRKNRHRVRNFEHFDVVPAKSDREIRLSELLFALIRVDTALLRFSVKHEIRKAEDMLNELISGVQVPKQLNNKNSLDCMENSNGADSGTFSTFESLTSVSLANLNAQESDTEMGSFALRSTRAVIRFSVSIDNEELQNLDNGAENSGDFLFSPTLQVSTCNEICLSNNNFQETTELRASYESCETRKSLNVRLSNELSQVSISVENVSEITSSSYQIVSDVHSSLLKKEMYLLSKYLSQEMHKLLRNLNKRKKELVTLPGNKNLLLDNVLQPIEDKMKVRVSPIRDKMAADLKAWLCINGGSAGSYLRVYPTLPCAYARLKMHIAQSNGFDHPCCLPCLSSYYVDEVQLLQQRIAEGNSRARSFRPLSLHRHFEISYNKLYLPLADKRTCYRPPTIATRTSGNRNKSDLISNHAFAHCTRTYHDYFTRWRDAVEAITQCASLLARFSDTTEAMWRRDARIVPTGINRKPNDAQLTDSWLSGGTFGSRSSVLVFRSSALAQSSDADIASKPGHKLHITFRVVQAETKLLAKLLECHGIVEASSDCNDYNILWTGSHPKPGILRSMAPHQRVNHFPRSYELTRKDRLYKNIEKMQHAKGLKHFDFIPQTFLMPTEYRELCTTHHRVKGPWIVKPAASSRGRGIYIVESPNQVPIEESVVVAKYISNPLLIKGHKCDLRLYVAVTSFDPLLIYIYEEGMVRFATVKYDTTHKQLWNPCMHLCNYSINKYHSDYVKSDDPSAENVGHKWTLSALLRHLKSIGKDTAALMMQVEDLVIKAILSCGNSIVTACKMFVPNSVNCFELYGFDILIDENLKPWLLEVNLSPSLGCDSPLDVRLKSAMLADLLTLIGIPAVDPMIKPSSPASTHSSKSLKMNMSNCRRIHSADGLSNHTLPKKASKGSISASNSSLTAEDNKMVKNAKGQFLRRGGFVRIFPAVDSWGKYAQYLDAVSGIPIAGSSTSIPFSFMGQHNNNLVLYKAMYPDMIITPTVPAGRIDKSMRMTHDRKRDGSLDSVRRCEGPVSTPRQDRYERKLSQGHRSTLSAPKKPLQEDCSAELKKQVCDMVKNGKKLSQVEARKAFSQYLMCVLKRISSSPDQDGHIEIVLKFLQKASTYLKSPFYVKIPSHKLSDKDRAAIVAKQLNDFLYLYNRETDLYADLDRPSQIPKNVFNEFLEHSSEGDLEELLILQNIHTVPNSNASSVSSFQGLLRCLPNINSICFSSPETAKKPVKVTPLS